MNEELLLTVQETAKLLRVNRTTVYKMVEANELPGVRRLGRAIRIHRPTVVAWLAGENSAPRARR